MINPDELSRIQDAKGATKGDWADNPADMDAESFAEAYDCGRYQTKGFMPRFMAWYRPGEFSPKLRERADEHLRRRRNLTGVIEQVGAEIVKLNLDWCEIQALRAKERDSDGKAMPASGPANDGALPSPLEVENV